MPHSCQRRLIWCAILASTMLTVSCSKDPEVAKREHLASADRYVASKDYKSAIIEYRNAVKLDPRFGEARFKLGQAYLAGNDPKDLKNAMGELVRAADLMPEDATAQLQAGRFLLMARQFEEAKARATNVLEKDKTNVDAQILLGNALVGLKDMDGAITQIELAIEGDPQRVPTYANLGLMQLARGDRKKAEDAFLNAVEAAPQSVDAHLALANYYWAVGQLADAEMELQRSLELGPTNPLTNQALATFYLRSNRGAEAERYLKAYVDASSDPLRNLTLADYYLMSKRPDEARPLLESLAAKSETLTASGLRLASLDFDAGRSADAHARIDQVLVHDPKQTDAIVMKGRFLAADGRTAEALTLAQSAISLAPNAPGAHFFAGKLLALEKKSEESLKEFTEVLRVAPKDSATHFEIAKLQLARGDVSASVEFAQEVVKSQPQSPTARVLLARGLMALNRLNEADKELRLLQTIAPNWADTQSALGEYYVRTQDARRARQAFTRTLELDPVSRQALAGLVTLDLYEGKTAAAKTRIEAQLATTPNDPPALFLAAAVYAKDKNATRTEDVLKRIIEIDPANMRAYGALAQLHIGQNRLSEARAGFDAIAKQQPKAIGAATMSAMLLQLENRQAEAQQRYEAIIAQEPNAAVAANNLAWLYAEGGGNLDLALQLARTAKAQIPDQPEVNDTLGWIYYKKGLSTLAVAALRESADKQPGNPTFSYHLALAYNQGGEIRLARQALERALATRTPFPEEADARRVLASLLGRS